MKKLCSMVIFNIVIFLTLQTIVQADTDECSANDGLGPCSQRCENTNGTYSCSCFKGYELSNKHDCVYKYDICTQLQKLNQFGACGCVNGLEGPYCDRNSSLCDATSCPPDQVCSTLHNIKHRCFDKSLQINLLLKIPRNVYMNNNIRNEILTDLKSIFEGRKSKVDILGSDNKVRRSLTGLDKVYIQDFNPKESTLSHTSVTLIAVNAAQQIPTSDACSILQNTNVQCIIQKD